MSTPFTWLPTAQRGQEWGLGSPAWDLGEADSCLALAECLPGSHMDCFRMRGLDQSPRMGRVELISAEATVGLGGGTVGASPGHPVRRGGPSSGLVNQPAREEAAPVRL